MQALSSKAAIATAVQAKAQQQRSARAAVVVRASAEVREDAMEASPGGAGPATRRAGQAAAYPNLTLGSRALGRPAHPAPLPRVLCSPAKAIARRPGLNAAGRRPPRRPGPAGRRRCRQHRAAR